MSDTTTEKGDGFYHSTPAARHAPVRGSWRAGRMPRVSTDVTIDRSASNRCEAWRQSYFCGRAVYLPYETWYEVAWQLRGQLACDEACALFWNIEVRRASNMIEDVEIVWQYARVKQPARKLRENGGVIIDALQQHSLIQQSDSRVTQRCARSPHVSIDLVRMINVQNENNRSLQATQPSCQPGINT
jgi:hypothetical protein